VNPVEYYKLKCFFNKQRKEQPNPDTGFEYKPQFDYDGRIYNMQRIKKQVKKMNQNIPIPISDEEFQTLAKEKGYIKKPTVLTEAVIAYRTYLFMFISLVIGELVVFLSSATFPIGSDGYAHWYVSPQTWQAFIINIIKDFLAIVIGKINNYHEQRKQEERETQLLSAIIPEVVKNINQPLK
jgi:hypothetical protein